MARGAGRVWRGARRGIARCTSSTTPTPPRSPRVERSIAGQEDALRGRLEVGRHHRDPGVRAPLLAEDAGAQRRRHRARGREASSPSPIRRPARTARRGEALPPRVHQPRRHRRAVLRAVVLRPGPGGAARHRRRRAARRRRTEFAAASGRRVPVAESPAVVLGAALGAAGPGGPRQADAGHLARHRQLRAPGSSSWSPNRPARRARGSPGRPRAARRRPRLRRRPLLRATSGRRPPTPSRTRP